MIDKIREIALKVLYNIEQKEAYSNLAFDEEIKRARKNIPEITKKDIGFISEIVYGTITWKLTIDEIIKKYSYLKLKKISPWILNILRMSIYQIIFLDKVPKSASVNEGVNLAKRYGHKASSNFVNAILRKVEKKDYEEFFAIKDDKERISKTTSMPEWIVQKLLEEYGKEKTQEICQNSNLKPKLHIRVNELKIEKIKLIEELKQEGINVKQGLLEQFLILEGMKNLETKKSFQEGKFTIQDEMAGFIPIILNPKPDEIVLDACSSPGGKTTFMAELMGNRGEIIAWDIHQHRVKLVEEVANRLGITMIKAEVKDATLYEKKYQEKFDKILLDVPCLGLGVLKRKPDIKWKRKEEEIETIRKTQNQILENCSNYLKPEGELVYSTCSILKEENEEVIERFLAKHNEFEVISLENTKIDKIVEKGRFIQIYQNEETDGFFIAKLRKTRS
ncbi:MAG: 16S rRNA (cytosine(967)-C(5))-methyltransferase RsmB [Clostridia bacterium]|nr:16S rRNA (cytosine(967)-C(5))-methyltransferase RsmB [Clostridia bacterium]